jgi:hypothetical protein
MKLVPMGETWNSDVGDMRFMHSFSGETSRKASIWKTKKEIGGIT